MMSSACFLSPPEFLSQELAMLVAGAVNCEDCLHGFTVRFRAVASFRAASRVKFSAAVHDVQGTACEWFTFQLDHFCTLWNTMRMVHVPALLFLLHILLFHFIFLYGIVRY